MLTVTTVLAIVYAYVAWRLGSQVWDRLALLIPFVLVWVVPALYWRGRRRSDTALDRVVLQASYLSMGWLSFALVLTLARDILLLSTRWTPALASVHGVLREYGVVIVIAGSLLALAIGAARAFSGPRIHAVDIPIADLHADLDGFRIAQISDVHVGRAIRARYVQKVVELTKSIEPDLVAITGDLVDGSVQNLAPDVRALRELADGGRAFFVLGNHDVYSGASAWSAQMRELGYHVLLNDHTTMMHKSARVIVAGVLDPAQRPGPQPDQAIANASSAAFRLLLAHNPRSAPDASAAGFDLQLSGHTHGGQFFPWTLVVRHVHAPHSHGLTREGRMWVYVSPGTGWWGPPVRLGTRPEVTLIRLVRARSDRA